MYFWGRRKFWSVTIVCVCLLLIRTHLCAQMSNKHMRERTFVPTIGVLAAVSVGMTTVEALEKRIGAGVAYTGMHPGGARQWFVRRQRCFLDVDGFDYSKHGRVIDYIVLTKPDASDVLPRKTAVAKLSSQRLLWLGGVPLGMRREQVLHWTKSRLPAPQIAKGSLTWKAKGFARINAHTVKTVWTASLSFSAQNRLTSIRIDAD